MEEPQGVNEGHESTSVSGTVARHLTAKQPKEKANSLAACTNRRREEKTTEKPSRNQLLGCRARCSFDPPCLYYPGFHRRLSQTQLKPHHLSHPSFHLPQHCMKFRQHFLCEMSSGWARHCSLCSCTLW